MPKPTQEEIASLITQVRCRIKLIARTTGEESVILDAFLDRVTALEADFKAKLPDYAIWPDGAAELLKSKLESLLETLNRVVSDGPTNYDSEMHKAYSSDATIFLLSLWAMLGTSMMIWLVWQLWPGERENVPMLQMLPLITVLGALGGYINCLQSFGRYVGNRQLLRSWTVYYLVFPLKGSGLALLVFLFLKMGIVTVQLGKASAQGFGTIGYCLVAGMSGLFANHAVEMLGSLLAIIFKPVTGKDDHREAADLKTDNILTAPSNPPKSNWLRMLKAGGAKPQVTTQQENERTNSSSKP